MLFLSVLAPLARAAGAPWACAPDAERWVVVDAGGLSAEEPGYPPSYADLCVRCPFRFCTFSSRLFDFWDSTAKSGQAACPSCGTDMRAPWDAALRELVRPFLDDLLARGDARIHPVCLEAARRFADEGEFRRAVAGRDEAAVAAGLASLVAVLNGSRDAPDTAIYRMAEQALLRTLPRLDPESIVQLIERSPLLCISNAVFNQLCTMDLLEVHDEERLERVVWIFINSYTAENRRAMDRSLALFLQKQTVPVGLDRLAGLALCAARHANPLVVCYLFFYERTRVGLESGDLLHRVMADIVVAGALAPLEFRDLCRALEATGLSMRCVPMMVLQQCSRVVPPLPSEYFSCIDAGAAGHPTGEQALARLASEVEAVEAAGRHAERKELVAALYESLWPGGCAVTCATRALVRERLRGSPEYHLLFERLPAQLRTAEEDLQVLRRMVEDPRSSAVAVEDFLLSMMVQASFDTRAFAAVVDVLLPLETEDLLLFVLDNMLYAPHYEGIMLEELAPLADRLARSRRTYRLFFLAERVAGFHGKVVAHLDAVAADLSLAPPRAVARVFPYLHRMARICRLRPETSSSFLAMLERARAQGVHEAVARAFDERTGGYSWPSHQ